MKNPFIEQSEDLLALDTIDVLDTSAVESIWTAKVLAEQGLEI